MFFVFSKILVVFIQPLTHIVCLLLVALLFYRKPRVSKACLVLALLWLMLFGTSPLPNALIRFLEAQYRPVSPLPQVDAVVVLSGMVVLEKSALHNIEFNESVDRILAGIMLMKQGAGDYLILAGGSGSLYNQRTSEARLLRQFAIESGVPEEKILIDSSSRNTHENAVNTKALLEKHGLTDMILITTASHLPRAMGCFKKLGLNPIPYGVDFHAAVSPEYHLQDFIPGASNLRRTSYILHEYVGLLMYKLAGYM